MGNTSSPPLQDRIIRIRELEQRGRNPRDSRQWKISVSCGTYYAVVNLVDPFIASEEASLRWALEEHPTHHPFKLYKSRTVSKELWRYSVSLMDQLNLHEVLTYPYPEDATSRRSFVGYGTKPVIEAGSPITRGRRWYVDIEGCFEGAAESIIHGLHWEALENPEIWPSHMRPCLIVRRKVPSNDILTHGPIIAIRAQSFRILLVVSHPSSQAAPTQMGGGRVANPRLVARPLADIVGQLTNGMIGATAPIQLEIVRPGTWKSLQEHLERRGKGYFHLIHFDVHGRVTHDKSKKQDLVSLAFLSDHSARKRSWRPAAEVSALLSTYGVKLVVLNASRSAKAFGACKTNIAETLIRDGVRAVIAFPYKVLNTGIEVFMSTFYQCLLTRSWDFAVALSEARRAMMKKQLREGRFGIKVLVEDWVVPILYNSGGTEVSVVGDDIGGDTTKSDSKGIFSKFHGLLQANISDSKPSVGGMGDQRQRKLIPKGIAPPGELVGRDGDIFRMETMLDTSVLRVVGSPGVGKSTLILHLCWWWKATSLVEDSFYFDCYENPHLNVEMIKRQLYLFLFFPNPDCNNTQKSVRNRSPIRGALLQHWSRSRSPSPVQGGVEIFPDDWAQRTLDKLRQTPYLIVLDSLESSDASVKHNERLKGEINEFLESLNGGRTVVIVVSNKQECWLNDSIVKFITYHLKRLDISHAIEFAGKVVEKCGGDRMRFRGAENQMYIRKLAKLVEMNPLVMNLTLPNIAIYDDSPQTIFTSLLQGAIPLGISDAPHTIKVMRNMTDLLERLDKDSKQLLLCLAPFWKRIPKDIDPYIHSLLYHKALPSTAEVVQQFSVSRNPSEWERQRAKSIISSTGLLLRYGYIIRDLLSLELLSESDIADPFSTLPQYYHVHPLLTLSLRRVIEKDQESPNPMITNYSTVTLAFLDYYTQQSARWVDNPNETYDLAAQEIQDDEINFLSAISIPLQFDNPDKLFDIFPLHIYSRFASMALVNRELAANAPLIAHFSELILQRFNELRARRGDSNVREIAMEIAMFASYWLCEYHSENSPTSKFRVQIERSAELMALANNISPNWQESLAILEEQAARQKSAAVSDGMTDGLRLRKPWSGFMISEVSRETSVIWEAKCDPDDIWLGLAMAFSRLKSIAIQVPLAARFSPALGEQLRKDLKLIWEDCIDSVTGTDLEPFLSSYEWVTILLEKAPIRPNEGLPVEETSHIPSSRFLGYPEFVRSQLMLQLRDTASAKRYLLDGLQRARNKSNFSAEILLRIRLCDLTFELRNWNECIEHLEWIRETMVQLGENITTADFSAYSRATWRKGICQTHLHQWDAAIEAFDEASGVCRHIHDHITEYAILRKLAAIKRESGLGEMTVAEALLKALTISYDPAFVREPAIVGERGALLQRIAGAMVKQKAGESAQSVIARLACARDTTEKEMHEFLGELITREKELTADDIRMGIPLHRTEKNLTKLYAEAEMIMFDPPRILAKKQLKWFVGSKWERGLLTKKDSL